LTLRMLTGWPVFVLTYACLSAVGLVVFRGLLRGRWARLVRTEAVALPVFWLLEFVADARGFWVFASTSGVTVMGLPAENVLFVAASVSNLTILYAWLERDGRGGAGG